MTWIVRPHDLAPTLVGAELHDLVAPAGEAGHTQHAVTARFDLFDARHPNIIPKLTALWVSTVGRDQRTRELLASVSQLAEVIDAPGDGPVEVPGARDIVPDATLHPLLHAMAQTAVEREVERLFPEGIEAGRAAWERRRIGDGTVSPVVWGGVPDDIARANVALVMSPSAPGRVEVVGLPDGMGDGLLVRIVADDGDPTTIALALVGGGVADLRDLDLPGRFRIELVDSTLRPVLTRATYLRSIARQWAFVGVASHRLGQDDLGNRWWRSARDAYVAEAGERARVAGGDADDVYSPEADACDAAVR